MTKPMMDLRALVEQSGDADLLREMIGFAAERLMELVLWNSWLLRQKGAAARRRNLRGSGGGGVVRSLVL